MSDNSYNIFYTDDDADDKEIFREVVAELNEDIYVFTQNNGSELMNLLKNPPPRPHVVFLDLNMPVKNGYEVLKELKLNEKIKHMPVIIFSTSNDPENIRETKRLGATLYVNKPSSYHDLKRILKHILSIDWKTFDGEGMDFVYKG